MDQNCISCHSPRSGEDDKIAPSLATIKAKYLELGMDRKEFTELMTAFLSKPSKDKALLPDAVDTFGLMPNLGMNDEQYDAAAEYLFYADLDKADWYENHHLKDKERLLQNVDEGNIDYLQKGMDIALATKAVLGKNLLTAIQERGTDQAVEFCNTRAITLTDSMAMALHAKVKRVSDKYRNPGNAANEKELEYIQQAKMEIAKNGKAKPVVFEQNGRMVGYYPILTNEMCLQCHGDPKKQIDSKTLAVLKRLYPEDHGTGYSTNELRGIWVIEMEK